jgi:hypothetical protein
MNKLKGRHNLDKDAKEIFKIASSELLSELSTLIAAQSEKLQIIVEQYEDSLGKLSESLERQRQKLNEDYYDALEIEKDARRVRNALGR